MLAESFYFVGILDEGLDLHRRAAFGAEQRVNFKNKFHATRPAL